MMEEPSSSVEGTVVAVASLSVMLGRLELDVVEEVDCGRMPRPPKTRSVFSLSIESWNSQTKMASFTE